MARITIIFGKTGAGKSRSVKGLNPKETVVINVLGSKQLPFKGSNKLYNTENKNLINLDNYVDIISFLKSCEEQPHIKNIVIDDMIYIMRKEFFLRAKEAGFTKFTELAQHFQQIVVTCELMRSDINVFFMLHSEDVQSDKTTTSYKVSTIGQLVDEKYNPLEVVNVALYADIKYNEKGAPIYGFYTNKTMLGSVEIPAKSPEGMFEETFIPNDLSLVVQKINEYYG